MKKLIVLFTALTFAFSSCSSNDDEVAQQTSVTVNFKAYWGDTEITASDFNQFKYTTELGQTVSIERLRYLVSNIQLTDQFGNSQSISTYNLTNVGEQTGLSVSKNITTFQGNHTLSFTFGFTDDDNTDGTYNDLNTANFNVPTMMGGGYHYMQFDGKYKDTNNAEQPFNYHAIRAVKRDSNGMITELKDTSFPVSISSINVQNNEATINVKADISKWFTNDWDLNVWNTPLMPNYDAQIQMNTNGKEVFSLLE